MSCQSAPGGYVLLVHSGAFLVHFSAFQCVLLHSSAFLVHFSVFFGVFQ
ncbi:unnamed protein product, partial [Staurois parvus]